MVDLMYRLTPTTRFILKQPIGAPIKDDELLKLDPNKIITIGDVSSQKVIDIIGKRPILAVIDTRINRKSLPLSTCDKLIKSLGPCREVINPAGEITDESVHIVQDAAIALSTKQNRIRCIKTIGEEDLLFLPIVKYFPVGFIIIYGFKGIGLLKVIITEELKDKVEWILSNMQIDQ